MSSRRLRRPNHSHRGQSLVEFALLLPVFLVLFGTALDLGRIAALQLVVTNAARQGALQAAKTPTDFDNTKSCPADAKSNLIVCRTALEASDAGVDIAPGDIVLSCDPTCDDGVGNRVTVRVTGHFELLTPFLTPFFGGNRQITFSVAATQQVETFPPAPTPVILTSAPPTATPSPTATATPAPTATASAAPTTPGPTPTPACQLPSAGFTYSVSPSNKRAPATVTVTDTSTSIACGISSWFWTFGDGTTSLDQNPPPHTYYAAGTYEISLTTSNAAGSNTLGGVILTVKP